MVFLSILLAKNLKKKKVDNLKIKMRKMGFKQSFVVAFFNGKQISTKEALSLQSKSNIYE